MKRYFLQRDRELTTEILGRIIQDFEVNELPILQKYEDYYTGKGYEIMKRQAADPTRPDNKVVKNFCSSIVSNFQGYITGIPVTYSAKAGEDIAALLDIFEENNVINEDSEFLKQALKYGVSYEIAYVNEDNRIRFRNIDTRSVIPIYSNDLEEDLLYVIYFTPIVSWDSKESDPWSVRYNVSVYDDTQVFTYIATNDFNVFQLQEQRPHYFSQVPFAIFNLNTENVSVFDNVISLADAYNTLLSDSINNFQAFVDAYLVLTNVQADEEDLAKMKASRTILLDGDSTAQYLTKNISDTQVQNLLDDIEAAIHTVSDSPDFSSPEFNSGVSSGVAIKYKLVGFDNRANAIEAQFTKALQQRITLINNILNLIDSDEANVNIIYKENLPVDIADTVATVNGLRGLVSEQTLLSQIPFISDVEEEMARKQEENTISLYDFNMHESEESEEE